MADRNLSVRFNVEGIEKVTQGLKNVQKSIGDSLGKSTEGVRKAVTQQKKTLSGLINPAGVQKAQKQVVSDIKKSNKAIVGDVKSTKKSINKAIKEVSKGGVSFKKLENDGKRSFKGVGKAIAQVDRKLLYQKGLIGDSKNAVVRFGMSFLEVASRVQGPQQVFVSLFKQILYGADNTTARLQNLQTTLDEIHKKGTTAAEQETKKARAAITRQVRNLKKDINQNFEEIKKDGVSSLSVIKEANKELVSEMRTGVVSLNELKTSNQDLKEEIKLLRQNFHLLGVGIKATYGSGVKLSKESRESAHAYKEVLGEQIDQLVFQQAETQVLNQNFRVLEGGMRSAYGSGINLGQKLQGGSRAYTEILGAQIEKLAAQKLGQRKLGEVVKHTIDGSIASLKRERGTLALNNNLRVKTSKIYREFQQHVIRNARNIDTIESVRAVRKLKSYLGLLGVQQKSYRLEKSIRDIAYKTVMKSQHIGTLTKFRTAIAGLNTQWISFSTTFLGFGPKFARLFSGIIPLAIADVGKGFKAVLAMIKARQKQVETAAQKLGMTLESMDKRTIKSSKWAARTITWGLFSSLREREEAWTLHTLKVIKLNKRIRDAVERAAYKRLELPHAGAARAAIEEIQTYIRYIEKKNQAIIKSAERWRAFEQVALFALKQVGNAVRGLIHTVLVSDIPLIFFDAFTEIRKTWKYTVDYIGSYFVTAPLKIVAAVSSLNLAIDSRIQNLGNTLVQRMQQIKNSLGQYHINLANLIQTSDLALVPEALRAVHLEILNGLLLINRVIYEWGQNLTGWLQNLIQRLGGTIPGVFNQVSAVIQSIVNAFGTAAVIIHESLRDLFGTIRILFDGIGTLASQLLSGPISLLQRGIEAAVNKFRALRNKIQRKSEVAEAETDTVKDAAARKIAAEEEKIDYMENRVKQFAVKTKGVFEDFNVSLSKSIEETKQKYVNKLQEIDNAFAAGAVGVKDYRRGVAGIQKAIRELEFKQTNENLATMGFPLKKAVEQTKLEVQADIRELKSAFDSLSDDPLLSPETKMSLGALYQQELSKLNNELNDAETGATELKEILNKVGIEPIAYLKNFREYMKNTMKRVRELTSDPVQIKVAQSALEKQHQELEEKAFGRQNRYTVRTIQQIRDIEAEYTSMYESVRNQVGLTDYQRQNLTSQYLNDIAELRAEAVGTPSSNRAYEILGMKSPDDIRKLKDDFSNALDEMRGKVDRFTLRNLRLKRRQFELSQDKQLTAGGMGMNFFGLKTSEELRNEAEIVINYLDSIKKKYGEFSIEATSAGKIASEQLKKINEQLGVTNQQTTVSVDTLIQRMEKLGLKPIEHYRNLAREAQKTYQAMKASGTASSADLKRAFEAMLEVKGKYFEEFKKGIALTDEKKKLKQLADAYEVLGEKSPEHVETLAKKTQRALQTIRKEGKLTDDAFKALESKVLGRKPQLNDRQVIANKAEILGFKAESQVLKEYNTKRVAANAILKKATKGSRDYILAQEALIQIQKEYNNQINIGTSKEREAANISQNLYQQLGFQTRSMVETKIKALEDLHSKWLKTVKHTKSEAEALNRHVQKQVSEMRQTISPEQMRGVNLAEYNWKKSGLIRSSQLEEQKKNLIEQLELIKKIRSFSNNDRLRFAQYINEQIARIDDQLTDKVVANARKQGDAYKELGVMTSAVYKARKKQLEDVHTMSQRDPDADNQDKIAATKAYEEAIKSLDAEYRKHRGTVEQTQKKIIGVSRLNQSEFNQLKAQTQATFSEQLRQAQAARRDLNLLAELISRIGRTRGESEGGYTTFVQQIPNAIVNITKLISKLTGLSAALKSVRGFFETTGQRVKTFVQHLREAPKATVKFYAKLALLNLRLRAGGLAAKGAAKGFTTLKGVMANLWSQAIMNVFMQIRMAVRKIAGSIKESGIAIEGFKTQLMTLRGNKAVGDKVFEELAEFARVTPFNLEEVIAGYIKLANRGITPTIEEMRALGDLAASMGRDWLETVDAVLSATQKSGQAIKKLGIGTKKYGEHYELIFQTGPVRTTGDPREIFDTIVGFGQGLGIEGGMERMAQTTKGQLSNLEDYWFQFTGKIWGNFKEVSDTVLSGLSSVLERLFNDADFTAVIQEMANSILGLLDQLKPLLSSLTTFFIEGFKGFLRFVTGTINFIKGYFKWFFGAAELWRDGLRGIRLILEAALVTLVAIIGVAITFFVKLVGAIVQGVEAVVWFVGGIVKGIWAVIKGIGKGIGYLLKILGIQKKISKNQKNLNELSEKYKKLIREEAKVWKEHYDAVERGDEKAAAAAEKRLGDIQRERAAVKEASDEKLQTMEGISTQKANEIQSQRELKELVIEAEVLADRQRYLQDRLVDARKNGNRQLELQATLALVDVDIALRKNALMAQAIESGDITQEQLEEQLDALEAQSRELKEQAKLKAESQKISEELKRIELELLGISKDINDEGEVSLEISKAETIEARTRLQLRKEEWETQLAINKAKEEGRQEEAADIQAKSELRTRQIKLDGKIEEKKLEIFELETEIGKYTDDKGVPDSLKMRQIQLKQELGLLEAKKADTLQEQKALEERARVSARTARRQEEQKRREEERKRREEEQKRREEEEKAQEQRGEFLDDARSKWDKAKLGDQPSLEAQRDFDLKEAHRQAKENLASELAQIDKLEFTPEDYEKAKRLVAETAQRNYENDVKRINRQYEDDLKRINHEAQRAALDANIRADQRAAEEARRSGDYGEVRTKSISAARRETEKEILQLRFDQPEGWESRVKHLEDELAVTILQIDADIAKVGLLDEQNRLIASNSELEKKLKLATTPAEKEEIKRLQEKSRLQAVLAQNLVDYSGSRLVLENQLARAVSESTLREIERTRAIEEANLAVEAAQARLDSATGAETIRDATVDLAKAQYDAAMAALDEHSQNYEELAAALKAEWQKTVREANQTLKIVKADRAQEAAKARGEAATSPGQVRDAAISLANAQYQGAIAALDESSENYRLLLAAIERTRQAAIREAEKVFREAVSGKRGELTANLGNLYADQLEENYAVDAANSIRLQLAIREIQTRFKEASEEIKWQFQGNKEVASEFLEMLRAIRDIELANVKEQFKSLKDTIWDAKDTFEEIEGSIRDNLPDAFTGFFENIITGTKSVMGAFGEMVNSILKSIIRITSQRIAVGILGSIFGFSDGGEVPNYARGGTVNEALKREGSNAVLAALTPGEEVLPVRTGEAQRYQDMKEKYGENPLVHIVDWADMMVMNYREGGTVGDHLLTSLTSPRAVTFGNVKPGNQTFSTVINQSYTINTPNEGGFRRSQNAIMRESYEQLNRAIQRR